MEEQELEDVELEGAVMDAPSDMQNGGVRTFFVFVDLPQHIEYRAGNLPILRKGSEIEMDTSLRHPRNPKKVRRIHGVYTVVRSVLKYGTTRPSLMGLTQYLELSEGPAAR